MLLVAVIGCDSGPRRESATGIVVAVGGSVAEIDAFTLRTNDGLLIDFEVDQLALAGGGKPAPHLREHMTGGEPIVVEYSVQDGRNLALRYYDAP